MSKISYQTPEQRHHEQLFELYRTIGWWSDEDDPSLIAPVIAGSFMVLGAFDGDRLVGCARVLSDGVTDAYIQDVVVDPAYRKRGIGGELVSRLAGALEQRKIDWIGLVGAPGTEHFYQSLGFERLEEHIPFRRKKVK